MKYLKIVWGKWKKVARRLGDFQARVLLILFYFSLLVPFSVLTTFTSKRFFKKQPKKSLWLDFSERYQSLEEAKGQY